MTLARGPKGVRRTIREMVRLIQRGRADPEVRRLAVEILRQAGARPRRERDQAEALFRWVQRNVRYQRDPVGVEMLSDARTLLSRDLEGDCDDMSVALCSLLESVGIPSALRVGRRRGRWAHVWVQAQTVDGDIDLDPSNDRAAPGWQPPGFEEVVTIPVGIGEPDTSGIGDLATALGALVGSAATPAIAGLVRSPQPDPLLPIAEGQRDLLEARADVLKQVAKRLSRRPRPVGFGQRLLSKALERAPDASPRSMLPAAGDITNAIRSRPWIALGLAAVVGYILGRR